jgi:hypothetical protein
MQEEKQSLSEQVLESLELSTITSEDLIENYIK